MLDLPPLILSDYPPIPPEMLRPSPLIVLPEPSPRAVVWPARTWSSAEKTTAAMMNGVRDQLNDLHTIQGTIKTSLIPQIIANNGTTNTSNVATGLDFQYLPRMAAYDTLVIDFEFHHNSATAVDISLGFWNAGTGGGATNIEVHRMSPWAPAKEDYWQVILRRYTVTNTTLFRTSVGGPCSAPPGGPLAGVPSCYWYSIADWTGASAQNALYLYYNGVSAGAVLHWKWLAHLFLGGAGN